MSKTAKWILGIIGALFLLFILFISLFLLFLFQDDSEEITAGSGGSLAVIELKEPILSSENIVRQFKRYRENSSIKGIVFRIDSPGGGVAASQEIYEEVKKTRSFGKPVVVSMGAVAASGGYYVACGADKIVANPGTVTGSIGVISQFLQFDQLLGKIGISSTTVKSGKFKDTGSPLRKFSKEEKEYLQVMINDVYDQFVDVVAAERKLPRAVVRKLADGRIYTGRMAYSQKLIDTLGTYEDAVALTAKLAHLKGTPRLIKERKKEKLTDFLFGQIKNNLQDLKQEIFQRPMLEYSLPQP